MVIEQAGKSASVITAVQPLKSIAYSRVKVSVHLMITIQKVTNNVQVSSASLQTY